MESKSIVTKSVIKAQLPTVTEFFDYSQELTNLWNLSERPSTYERKVREGFL